ncbi:hypothetical protein [Marinifilum fragile]|uniref:hypothetical protein n=1 Tax=Marinifilum fragile TaxID=570161 RepID=UPI002AA73D23|nr:hypothetical protein [Marinifilum fragile]
MKKIFLFLSLFLVVVACDNEEIINEIEETESKVSNETLSARTKSDLEWDWTTSEILDMYRARKEDGKSIRVYSRSPFFSESSSNLAQDQDMHPEDGWMLVFKNFGTATEAPKGGLPSFALYNKYSGVFRVMVYIPQELRANYSYFLTNLELTNNSDKAPIFTFYSNPSESVLSNHDTSVNLFQTGDCYDYQHFWAVSDFIVSGYDRNIASKDIVFDLTISGVDITYVEGTATGTIEQILKKRRVSGFWKLIDNLKNGVDTGVSFYKSADDAIGVVNDLFGSDDNSGTAIPSSIEGGTNTKSSVAGVVTGLSAAIGFVQGILKGTGSQVPLKMKANFDVKLKMNQQSTLYHTQIAMSPNNQTYMANKPVQTIPWGVFNLKAVPKYSSTTYEYFKKYEAQPYKKIVEQIVDVNTNDFRSNIEVNPELTNVSFQVGYVKRRYSDKPNYFTTFSSIAGNTLSEFYDGTIQYYPDPRIVELAIKITNKYLHPVDGWKEVSIIKTYPVTLGSSSYKRIDDNGNEGPIEPDPF